MTETIAFEVLEDGHHVKHKNKNTELRRSDQGMEWTSSQDMNLGYDLQKSEGGQNVNVTFPPNTEMTETVVIQAIKDRVQCSMSDIESPNTGIRKTQDVCEKLQNTHAKLRNKNAKLRRSVIDMNRTVTQEKLIVSDLQKRVQCLELERERTLDVNKQLQGDIEKLQNMYSSIYLENEKLEKSLSDMTRTLSHEKEIISDLQQRTASLVLERQSILAVNMQLWSDNETLKNMYSNSQWNNGQIEKSLNDMARTLSQEKETVSDLQNRLSKLAGDILTHENTNITDLSDPNRPMKLSETYSEIYDNEWTDAFEELTGRGLTDILAIRKLRDMLLCSFRKCRDVTWERYKTLKSTMSTVDIVEILPSMRDFTEPKEKTETNSNESELSSRNETYNSRSINSEGQHKEPEEKSETNLNESELTSPKERYNSRSISSEAQNKEHEEETESNSSESELTSRNETYDSIPINSKAQNKKPEEKTETNSNESELTSPNETFNSRSINSDAKNREETYRDSCVNSASRETELLYQRNIEGERTSQSKKEHLTCTTALTVEQEKEIKRIWRTTTNALMDESVRNLHILLLTKFDISIEDWPNTSKYLARCIDLCWKMGVQEKPMHLDACDEKCDCCEKIFNHDKYRAYMQTGKRVAFVVWPALFLHEGGAMLVKGIAQGCQ